MPIWMRKLGPREQRVLPLTRLNEAAMGPELRPPLRLVLSAPRGPGLRRGRLLSPHSLLLPRGSPAQGSSQSLSTAFRAEWVEQPVVGGLCFSPGFPLALPRSE